MPAVDLAREFLTSQHHNTSLFATCPNYTLLKGSSKCKRVLPPSNFHLRVTGVPFGKCSWHLAKTSCVLSYHGVPTARNPSFLRQPFNSLEEAVLSSLYLSPPVSCPQTCTKHPWASLPLSCPAFVSSAP
jgi:hypothetical protein